MRLLVSLSFLFLAFGNHTLAACRPSDTSPVYKAQIRRLITGYSELKVALTEPDTRAAQLSAQRFARLITDFDPLSLVPAEKQLYLTATAQITQLVSTITATTDLGQQREQFKMLSNYMAKLIVADQPNVVDEDGVTVESTLVQPEVLEKATYERKQKVIILYQDGNFKVSLRYCPVVKGYYLTEKDDKENPYLSREKK